MVGGPTILRCTQWVKSTEIVTSNSLHCKVEVCWPLVNELEQAWTGVEESDRSFIRTHVQQGHFRHLIMVCLLSYTITES
jgi:hypothetical protein